MRAKHLIAFFLVILLSSCAAPIWFGTFDHKRGIAIYEMPSLKRVSFIPNPPGKYGEWIIHVDEGQRTIYTILGWDNDVKMRIIGFNGEVFKEVQLPVDNLVSAKELSSLSPDMKHIAYVSYDEKDQKVRLFCINLQSLDKTVLSDDFNEPGCIVSLMQYISDTQILSVQFLPPADKKSGERFDKIKIFDTKSRTFISALSNECMPDSFLFSRDNRYLAYSIYSSKCKNYHDVCIMDVSSSTIIEIDHDKYMGKSGSNQIYGFKWSPDGEHIAYIRGYQDIIMLSTKDYIPRVVHKKPWGGLSFDDGISTIGFLNDRNMYYIVTGMLPFMYYKFRTLNLDTGEVTKYFRMPYIHGEIYAIENGKKLICEVGY